MFKRKSTIWLIAILIALLVVYVFRESWPKKSYRQCSDETMETMEIFKQVVFAEIPVKRVKVRDCINTQFGDETEMDALLRINYNIDKDFEYSTAFILLQQHKELFELLKDDSEYYVAIRYSKMSDFCDTSFAIILPRRIQSGKAFDTDKHIIIPMMSSLRRQRIELEQIIINNKSLKSWLNLSEDGKILDPGAEAKFLQRVAELKNDSAKLPVSNDNKGNGIK